MEPSHDFRKYSFKTFTWCDMCNKFIWGARKQGYKCKVCRMNSHKGSCKVKANTSTHCSQRFYEKTNGSLRLDGMTVSRKKVSLNSMIETIKKEDMVRSHRVDAFLALITSIPGYVDQEEYFECFNGKLLAPTQQLDPLSQNLRYNTDTDETVDVLSLLDFWIERGQTTDERVAVLKVLEVLSGTETNKSKILIFGHADTITKLLLPMIERDRTEEPSLEEVKYAHSVFRILKRVCDNRERQLILVKNDILDRILSFLKVCKKVEHKNIGIYKDTKNRAILRAMRDEGYLLLLNFHQTFYEIDPEVTNYMCSRHSLDLIMDAASKSVISIAPDIDPGDVTLHETIYRSPLCEVYLATWKEQQVAVKIFDPDGLSFNISSFRKEITMFTLIKHPNSCPFIGAYRPPKTDKEDLLDLEKPFIVMKYIPKGSLSNYLDQRVEELKRKNLYNKVQVIDTCTLVNLAMNAANCIQYLHSRYIIHRDIKPGNFLIDENFVLRVTDFGVSRVMEDTSSGKYTFSGTEVWMAPEIYEKKYDHKVDTYSFGLVLWSMLTGTVPFNRYGTTSIELAPAIARGEREDIPVFQPPIQEDLVKLILTCWDGEPTKRPDFLEILDILYNMRSPYTNLPYTHMYDGLDDKTFTTFVNSILIHLDSTSRIAFLITNKKFYSMLDKMGK